jgi:hypothetical protein
MLNFIYGLPPRRKRLIDFFGGRGEPAVVYPASEVGAVWARADMESANTTAPIDTSGKREAAGEVIGVKRCGATRFAMMGDQTLRKAQEGFCGGEA